MKKTLFIILLALTVVLAYGSAYALTGVCSNCHTMHNSQDGQPMAKDFDGDAVSTPNPNLTISTCLGCHNGQVTGAPNVFGNGAANQTAGGTFNDTVIAADTQVHNVVDLNAAGVLTEGLESVNTTGTPGNSGSAITVDVDELTCAGALGCHGDHASGNTTSALGIKGFHHAARDSDRSSKGYRFLQTAAGTEIEGKGSTDSSTGWEKGGADADDHNVYSADTSAGISKLCAQCHGGFHGTANTGSASPFVRHPTDNVIPDAWDTVGTGVTVDYNNNPFAFDGTDIVDVTIAAAYDVDDGARVACVSCHRAHGSDQPDLLRFDYDGQIAGGDDGDTFGCLGCHTLQR